MSFEDCLGTCRASATVLAAQESCTAGVFDKTAMQDPANTGLIQWDSVSSYNEYVSLVSYLIPIIVIVPIALNMVLDILFMYEPCYGKVTSDRLSIIRDKHWYRGFGLFVGSLTAAIMLLTERWTGLDVSQMLRLDGTPNLYYSVQLLVCQWLMAQSLVCLAFAYRKISVMCVQSFIGMVTLLLAVSYWLFLEPTTDETRQVVGVLLLLTSALIYLTESYAMEWHFGTDAGMPHMVDSLVINKSHPNYLHDPTHYESYRTSKLYKKKHAKVALHVTNRKVMYLFVADLLFLVGNALQFSRSPEDAVRMAVVQVDEWRCGTYWPLLFLVVFGFAVIVWCLLAVIVPWCWRACCAPPVKERKRVWLEMYSSQRTEGSQKHMAWSITHPASFVRLVNPTELEPVGSSAF